MSLKHKIKELQQADEGTKKFWLIVLSGMAMTIIVTAWMVYLDTTLPSVNDRGEGERVRGETENELSGWETFKTGWREIKNDLDEKFQVIKQMTAESMEAMQKQSTYESTKLYENTKVNEMKNFEEKIYEPLELEPVPAVELP